MWRPCANDLPAAVVTSTQPPCGPPLKFYFFAKGLRRTRLGIRVAHINHLDFMFRAVLKLYRVQRPVCDFGHTKPRFFRLYF